MIGVLSLNSPKLISVWPTMTFSMDEFKESITTHNPRYHIYKTTTHKKCAVVVVAILNTTQCTAIRSLVHFICMHHHSKEYVISDDQFRYERRRSPAMGFAKDQCGQIRYKCVFFCALQKYVNIYNHNFGSILFVLLSKWTTSLVWKVTLLCRNVLLSIYQIRLKYAMCAISKIILSHCQRYAGDSLHTRSPSAWA